MVIGNYYDNHWDCECENNEELCDNCCIMLRDDGDDWEYEEEFVDEDFISEEEE